MDLERAGKVEGPAYVDLEICRATSGPFGRKASILRATVLQFALPPRHRANDRFLPLARAGPTGPSTHQGRGGLFRRATPEDRGREGATKGVTVCSIRRDVEPMWTQLATSPLRAQLAEGERARIRGEAASSAGQRPRTEAGRGLPRRGREGATTERPGGGHHGEAGRGLPRRGREGATTESPGGGHPRGGGHQGGPPKGRGLPENLSIERLEETPGAGAGAAGDEVVAAVGAVDDRLAVVAALVLDATLAVG